MDSMDTTTADTPPQPPTCCFSNSFCVTSSCFRRRPPPASEPPNAAVGVGGDAWMLSASSRACVEEEPEPEFRTLPRCPPKVASTPPPSAAARFKWPFVGNSTFRSSTWAPNIEPLGPMSRVEGTLNTCDSECVQF